MGNQECDLPDAERGTCFRKERKGPVTPYAVGRWYEVEMEKRQPDSAAGAPWQQWPSRERRPAACWKQVEA